VTVPVPDLDAGLVILDLSQGTYPAREQRHDDELSGGPEV